MASVGHDFHAPGYQFSSSTRVVVLMLGLGEGTMAGAVVGKGFQRIVSSGVGGLWIGDGVAAVCMDGMCTGKEVEGSGEQLVCERYGMGACC